MGIDWLDCRLDFDPRQLTGYKSWDAKPPMRGYRQVWRADLPDVLGSCIAMTGHPENEKRWYLSCSGARAAEIWPLLPRPFEVARVDSCVDLPVPTAQVIDWVKANMHQPLLHMGSDSGGWTCYINRRPKTGTRFTKSEDAPQFTCRVYDKAKEQRLEGDLTRIEVTCRPQKEHRAQYSAFNAGQLLAKPVWVRPLLEHFGVDLERVGNMMTGDVRPQAGLAADLASLAHMATQYRGALLRVAKIKGFDYVEGALWETVQTERNRFDIDSRMLWTEREVNEC
jgi:hypothetical protein